MKIILYSTNCPKCNVIKMKLEKLNLPFTIIEDVDEVVKFGESHGISSAPILVVDNEIYDFSGAIKYFNGAVSSAQILAATSLALGSASDDETYESYFKDL